MLDLAQVRSFLAVFESGSFSRAAAHLGIGQSTVSQHVRRLETYLQNRLFERDTHTVALTPAGEQLLPEARRMIEIAERVEGNFLSARLRGRIRFGLSEDLVSSTLPRILESFSREHPLVDLELTVALSETLFAQQKLGDVDLVLAKRRLGQTHGRCIARQELVWLARNPLELARKRPLPLVAFPPPSLTRSLALEALDGSNTPWRISCTCGSLSGLTAAARAGLGLFVQPRSLRPEGLEEVPKGLLPELEMVEFILVKRKGADEAVSQALSEVILRQAALQL